MTNYTTLDIEQVVYIHEKILETSGGSYGIRDFSLLHSALERCKATFAGEDLYLSLFAKASALFHSLVMNHAFLDGNKRTGYAVMTRFLNSNGYQITSTQEEIVRMCLIVESKSWKIKEIVVWLEQNTQKLPR